MTAALNNFANIGATPPPQTNDLFPQRAGFERPDRDDDLQPGRVQAAAKRFNGAPLEAADGAIRYAESKFRQHLNSIDTDRYSPSGLAEQIANFAGSDAYKAVDPAVQSVSDAAEIANQKVADVRESLSSDGDTAAELRATRYWNRTQRVLDALADPSRLLRTASGLVESASRTELGTLLQELPDYMQSRGQDTSGWLTPVVAQHVPEYAHALAEASLASKARDATQFNAKLLRDRVSKTEHPNGYRPPVFVPLSAIQRAGADA